MNVAIEYDTGTLSALLIPLQSGTLLLPHEATAELISWQIPQVDESQPNWLLGTIYWRELPVPLISFELASGQHDFQLNANDEARIVILNTACSEQGLSFIGVVVSGTPRSVQLTEEDITEKSDEELACLEKMAVVVEGEAVIIPDTLTLEAMLLEHLKLNE